MPNILNLPHFKGTTFELTGSGEDALWLVNNQPNFGNIPKGIIPGLDGDIPIRLHYGVRTYTGWGSAHIDLKHWQWLKRHQVVAHQMVWHKLGSTGFIYTAEEGNKKKISLRVEPASLMILKLRYTNFGPYFSVTTVYQHPSSMPDGESLGRYLGRRR